MTVLYNDKDIVVCIKPVGVISQSDSGGGEDMIKLLREELKSEIFPLHRLDREVGGVMVYAKTKFAAAQLSKDIAEQKFIKEYFALVHGIPSCESGEMRDLLFKDSRKNKSFVVDRVRKGVKEALLEYELHSKLQINGAKCSFIRIRLHTGRTHQIRVQFASRGMSLVGDRKYGASDSISKIGLLSYRISFRHPATKKEMVFSVSAEDWLKDFIENISA